MRILRLLPLLFAFSLAPLLFAQSADLSVTVTMPSTAFYSDAGNSASTTGQVTVTNAGPSTAQNVTMDFGTNASSASFLPGFDCWLTNGRYLCTAVSMATGTISGTFRVTWPLASNGTVERTTVTVTSASPADPNTTNNSASGNTTVVWQADLQLAALGVAGPAAPGVLLGVTAGYTNNGPSPASDFKLTITVPPGTVYDSYGAVDESLKCTEPPQGGTGDLVCTGSSVEVGTSEVGLTVRVDPAAVPGTVVTLSETLTSSDAIKPVLTSSGSLTVLEPADLHAEISAPASATAGGTFLTTMTVTNHGPASAVEMAVFYSQQGGGFYGPMTGPAGWTCGTAKCTTDSFAPGATATFTIPTTIPTQIPPYLGSGTLTGKVTAFSPSDPNQADNVARASTTVGAPPARRRAVRH